MGQSDMGWKFPSVSVGGLLEEAAFEPGPG